MNRAERRRRTRKVQLRRYRLIRYRNDTDGHYSWRGEWQEPMWWFDHEKDFGQLRNDQNSDYACWFKAHERDLWAMGKRVKAIRANLDFAEALEEQGFTHKLRMSIYAGTGLWD